MANACFTTISVAPKVPGEAERVGVLLEKWLEERFSKELVSASQLRNFALHAGFNPDDFDLNGEVVYIYHNDSFVYILAEDCWSPKLVFWFALFNRFLGVDQFSFGYTADEVSSGVFNTNDIDLLKTFYWDNFGVDPRVAELIGDDYYSVTAEETRGFLLQLLPDADPKATLKELLPLCKESEFSTSCSIYEWQESNVFDNLQEVNL